MRIDKKLFLEKKGSKDVGSKNLQWANESINLWVICCAKFPCWNCPYNNMKCWNFLLKNKGGSK